jgi:hypothetical protein
VSGGESVVPRSSAQGAGLFTRFEIGHIRSGGVFQPRSQPLVLRSVTSRSIIRPSR